MKPYQDPDILKHLYWNENLSQQAIGQKLGVDSRTISLWMIKLNVPRRNQALATHLGNANHFTLSPSAISFLSGCLLGDGCISMNKSISAVYQHTNKHKAYIEWLKAELLILSIECCGNILERKQSCKDNTYYRTDKTYLSYRLCTRSYPELATLREKWYGPNGKQPPDDLELTPITLRQWFMDDGHYRHSRTRLRHNGKWYTERGTVRLCNRSFSVDKKQFLVEQLCSIGLDGIVHPQYIYIPTEYTKRFFEIIGPCPVPNVYDYKWPTGEPDKR